MPTATMIATRITSQFSRQCASHVTGVRSCNFLSSFSASVWMRSRSRPFRAVPNELSRHRALARQLGLFGTTMAVMGGTIGAGIFINPYLVAQRVHTSGLIIAAWVVGGLIALAGGFIYAELGARLPVVGGQYA